MPVAELKAEGRRSLVAVGARLKAPADFRSWRFCWPCPGEAKARGGLTLGERMRGRYIALVHRRGAHRPGAHSEEGMAYDSSG